MSDQFDDHTLLINTFNRPQYLYRLLRSIAEDLPIGGVLIVDGSTEPSRSQNREIVAPFAERMPVRHVQLDDGVGAIEQFDIAAHMVETPFVTLCHDDNFMVASVVRKSIQFLRDHDDYAACCGGMVWMTQLGDRVSVSISEIAPLEQDAPLDRLSHLLASHWPTDFATWRSDARKFACPALTLYTRDETFAEPLHAGLGALCGKVHVLPDISIVFSSHDANLNYDALNRQFGPASPDFMDTIDAGAQIIDACCAERGIPVPESTRLFYLRAYLHWMAFNPVMGEGIGRHLRQRVLDSMSESRMAEIDAQMLAAVQTDFLGLSRDEMDLLRDSRSSMRDDIRAFPVLFTLEAGCATLFDHPEVAPANDASWHTTPSRSMPTAYQAVLRGFAEGDWAARYADFEESFVSAWFSALPDAQDRSRAFAGTFMLALNRLIRPLYDAHAHAQGPIYRSVYFAGQNNMLRHDNEVSRSLLAISSLFQVFPSMPFEDGMTERRVAPATGLDCRMALPTGEIFEAPNLGCRSREMVLTADSCHQTKTCQFVRLDYPDEVVATIAAGGQAWITVELAEQSGQMKFALFDGETFNCAQDVLDGLEVRQLSFPVESQRHAFLVAIDQSPDGQSGLCRFGGFRWVYRDAAPHAGERPDAPFALSA